MPPAAKIPQQPWMSAPETLKVLAALGAGGKPARFVGGCVRDALAGRRVRDIDIATPETPQDVMRMLKAARIKAIPTGIDHGTVTAVVRGKHFEITTLRRDVETFGRHARVAFTDDWQADAQRRDFTMNALFLDAEGEVFDSVGGVEDLRRGRVRFVGRAEDRIREDVLRLLRFFRFHSDYGAPPPDPEALEACRRIASSVVTLSAERVWSELRKILISRDTVATLDLMDETGVLTHVLPQATRRAALARLIEIEAALALDPDPVLRLAAASEADAATMETVARRLRMSNAEIKRLSGIAAARGALTPDTDRAETRRALHRIGGEIGRDLVLVDWADASGGQGAGISAPGWRDLWDLASAWTPKVLPVGGADVLALGVSKGKRVGELLASVEEWWIARDFTPDRAACLAELARLAVA